MDLYKKATGRKIYLNGKEVGNIIASLSEDGRFHPTKVYVDGNLRYPIADETAPWSASKNYLFDASGDIRVSYSTSDFEGEFEAIRNSDLWTNTHTQVEIFLSQDVPHRMVEAILSDDTESLTVNEDIVKKAFSRMALAAAFELVEYMMIDPEVCISVDPNVVEQMRKAGFMVVKPTYEIFTKWRTHRATLKTDASVSIRARNPVVLHGSSEGMNDFSNFSLSEALLKYSGYTPVMSSYDDNYPYAIHDLPIVRMTGLIGHLSDGKNVAGKDIKEPTAVERITLKVTVTTPVSIDEIEMQSDHFFASFGMRGIAIGHANAFLIANSGLDSNEEKDAFMDDIILKMRKSGVQYRHLLRYESEMINLLKGPEDATRHYLDQMARHLSMRAPVPTIALAEGASIEANGFTIQVTGTKTTESVQ